MTDHYDSRAKVLRLSSDVYRRAGRWRRSASPRTSRATPCRTPRLRPVGHPQRGRPGGQHRHDGQLPADLHRRAAAREPVLIWPGIVLFSAFVAFQIVNLPVEFNASSRAKAQLVSLGIIDQDELRYVEQGARRRRLDLRRRHAPGDPDAARIYLMRFSNRD